MSSSFLIMYPDIPVKALSYSVSSDFQEDFPLENSFEGARENYCYINPDPNDININIEFALATAEQRKIDHIIFGGALSLMSYADLITVQALDNTSVWQTQLSFAMSTFIGDGPRQEDVVITSRSPGNQAYTQIFSNRFKIIIHRLDTQVPVCFRRLYLGAALDMEREPSSYNINLKIERDGDTWKYPRGQVIMSKAYFPKHEISIDWDGVSDSKANEVVDKLLSDPYRNTVYLYTETYRDPLYNNGLILCRLVPEQCSIQKSNAVPNWNDVRLVFEEV